MYKYTKEDEARFWNKVNRAGSCWVWTSQLRGGYGLFRLNRKIVSAHRLSYYMHYGKIDEALQVRHTCDNPPCVNPEHLLQGTAKTNSDDKFSRGRGQGNLSDEQVLAMRNEPVTSTMVRDIAAKYNISRPQARAVLVGEVYQHLPGAVDLPQQYSGWKLTHKEAEEIKAELENPYWGQQVALSLKYGVSVGVIGSIARERVKYARD